MTLSTPLLALIDIIVGIIDINFDILDIEDGHSVEEVLAVDEDFPNRLGLAEAVSPLRLSGMRAILRRIKRQIREKLV